MASPNIQNEEQQQLQLTYKNSKRLLRLIDELMDFSKVENNRLQLAPHEVDIVEFTKEVCQYFNDQAIIQNIHFQLSAPQDKIMAWIDTNKFEKIIFNLLSNAFKYTNTNGTIKVELDHLDNKEFILAITNTGPGIEENEIDKIFERYYQVNFSINKRIAGTGIGLSMVKSYVGLHHGQIEVTSKPGLETCFKITIPTNKNELTDYEIIDKKEIDGMPKNEDARQVAEVLDEEIKKLKKEPVATVLIVDDNPEIRKFIQKELSHIFNIIEAVDGFEGIEKTKELNPDLIICDLIMPSCNGIELCRTLKNDMATSHIPIVLLTAKAEMDSQIEGLDASCSTLRSGSAIFLSINSMILFRKSWSSVFLATPFGIN